MAAEEWFDIVDEQDRVVGRALRSECHGNPGLIHRVAHVLVIDGQGRLLLQKRSLCKGVQPGRWDTSVGGHLDPGEGYYEAALREMREELGIDNVAIRFLYHSRLRNAFESENVATYLARYDGDIRFDPVEIDAVRFFSPEEIAARLGEGFFTPNFEQEWHMFNDWRHQSF
ncbi:NUDIX domain-containing protein [Syntrophotalea acetylenica]|uniref:NUDIX hydrolase n=1 Tax=Syntrophotalea acetylenica TaxID=29542 RepID=UPI002A35F525|nr:NUDIX domain-containing protein [Syntrophotalea acetylenica]MDY0262301.1 NUDIX domain-containing protein [Syntrophotalea acetylenica]